MSDSAPPHHPEPTPIPIPSDFPFTWAHPDDARLPLELDRMHFPDPVPPLEYQIWEDAMHRGFNPAHDAYGIPIHMQMRRINTYMYTAIVPSAPLEDMEVRSIKAEENLNTATYRLEERWNTAWLPEIKSHLAFWDAFNLKGADMASLTAHLEETRQRTNRLWEIHFEIVTPVYAAISRFDDLYRDVFGDGEAFQAYRLIQGFSNKSLETDRVLWALSRKAAAAPEVRRIIVEYDNTEVVSELKKTPDGQTFLADLDAFLAVYGQRGPTWSLALPSWIEDPAPVITNLKDYITRPDHDPMADLTASAAERDQAITSARERLKGYPQPVVNEFEARLKPAQCGNVLTEDHGFWIDFSAMYRVRRVIMEIGRRLADMGNIRQADDIFYLNFEEVRAAMAGAPADDLPTRVEDRRAELAHFRTVTPPMRLGTDYGPPPDNAFTRTFGKFFGMPPRPSEEPDTFQGSAGSPGKMRGTARVIRSMAEAEKLQLGDVLVAETTSPPWTPLFATAGAIVTDTGGILSHCAVVAREYRIPAVVGTGIATTKIKDGQMLEVDGDSGVVRIVS